MNIYLAGKIAKNDWRHTIVDDIWAGFSDQFYQDYGRTTVANPAYRWPVLRRSIFNYHNYTGPFFISCDHGCAHGDNLHGVAAVDLVSDDKEYLSTHKLATWSKEELEELEQDEHGFFVRSYRGGCLSGDGPRQEQVVTLCQEAIRQSDVVFVWLDQEDAYGTLVELGYAKALQKRVWIAGPAYLPDMWFAYRSADRVLVPQPDARTALQALLVRVGEYVVPPGARAARCRSCGAAIVWATTVNQKLVPLDLGTVEERGGQRFAIVHFARCPGYRRR
jgi:nucleoside 2-deoxyribosyltransferase